MNFPKQLGFSSLSFLGQMLTICICLAIRTIKCRFILCFLKASWQCISVLCALLSSHCDQ